MNICSSSGLLLEAESFDDYGGWVLDSQFESTMGSPYLLAHGNGKPVADAITSLSIPIEGSFHVWVRSKDWVPGFHPGSFAVSINDKPLDTVFGANDRDWTWQSGGIVQLPQGHNTVALHDLTGFCGRCDAIYFGMDSVPPPNTTDAAAREWRRRLRDLPSEPVDAGTFHTVVVGGGIAGIAAALAAARLGERVALVQNRPYLGGNASLEIGLSPRGINGPFIEKLSQRTSTGDLIARQLLEETTAIVFVEHEVFSTVVENSVIKSIDAREARSGKEIRIKASIFVDCSGTAILGLLSGARTLFGQEAKAEFNESLAPEVSNDMHHGNTLFFRTRTSNVPVSFPQVPWAMDVAKDFSDLRGQLTKPGTENGPGPLVVPKNYVQDPNADKKMNWPLTHFWEYGQWLDPYTQGEHIRDHLLRSLYGTFYNVKTMEPEKHSNLDFDWVAFVSAQGEYRRYEGDYILTENDIREHKEFPDTVAQNGGAFCLHYPGDTGYDFRLKNWVWDERDHKPYNIPFRSLYSANIANLMMAGKHMSATHIASSNTKFMGNGGQHGIAVACAAHLCHKYQTQPRGILENHILELQVLAAKFQERGREISSDPSKM